MKKLSITLLIALYAFCANANIIKVPLVYNSIQAAINASVNGDTVLVSSGVYFENINFRGKKILVTSLFYLAKDTAYISSTIINGSTPLNSDTASCVIFNSGEDSTSILQGFTLTGGLGTKWTDIHGAGVYREGGGILMDLSSPTIRYNIIINNTATSLSGVTSAGGGGIRIGDGNPTIENNLIVNNQGKYGPGIVLNYTGCKIRNNIIASNSGATSYLGGSGIWIFSNLSTTPKIIENNTIVYNSSYSAGIGGIYIQAASNVIIRNNIIWGNVPATPQIKAVSCTVQATYNDVQGSYTGTGNLNANPLLDSLCFILSASSPCIDAGDTSSAYHDVSAGSNTALFPSMNTIRNDMGAYGGPNAFLMHCSKTSVGINEINKPRSSVTIYPNPSNGNFTVETSVTTPQLIEVYDLTGRIVKSQTIDGKAIINGFDLVDGVYNVKITGNTTITNKRIVIAK